MANLSINFTFRNLKNKSLVMFIGLNFVGKTNFQLVLWKRKKETGTRASLKVAGTTKQHLFIEVFRSSALLLWTGYVFCTIFRVVCYLSWEPRRSTPHLFCRSSWAQVGEPMAGGPVVRPLWGLAIPPLASIPTALSQSKPAVSLDHGSH